MLLARLIVFVPLSCNYFSIAIFILLSLLFDLVTYYFSSLSSSVIDETELSSSIVGSILASVFNILENEFLLAFSLSSFSFFYNFNASSPNPAIRMLFLDGLFANFTTDFLLIMLCFLILYMASDSLSTCSKNSSGLIPYRLYYTSLLIYSASSPSSS